MKSRTGFFIVFTILLFSDISNAEPNIKRSRVIRSPFEWPSWDDVKNWFSNAKNNNKEENKLEEYVEEDYCVFKPWPTEPTFAETKLRISERKCMQYDWTLNLFKEYEIRSANCLSQKARKGFRFVLGGEDTKPGEFPHMAAIGWSASVGTWIFKCGGTLISLNFVLTAAHCMSVSPSDSSVKDVIPKIVRLGDKNILDFVHDKVKPVEIAIKRRIAHPRYSPPKKYYDIALLELQSEVYFTNQVHPACLPKIRNYNPGTKSTILGWGVVKTGALNTSPELQKAQIDILSTEICSNLLSAVVNRNWGGFEDHQMCAGVLAGGVDTCQGDSGGPLQIRARGENSTLHTVVGITSFGNKCGLANSPGVYTRVSAFIDWIEQIVWPGN